MCFLSKAKDMNLYWKQKMNSFSLIITIVVAVTFLANKQIILTKSVDIGWYHYQYYYNDEWYYYTTDTFTSMSVDP